MPDAASADRDLAFQKVAAQALADLINEDHIGPDSDRLSSLDILDYMGIMGCAFISGVDGSASYFNTLMQGQSKS